MNHQNPRRKQDLFIPKGGSRARSYSQIRATPNAKPKRAGIVAEIQATSVLLPAELPGNSLATVAVALADEVKQLAVPQLYPEGQHPAVTPALDGHMDQPLAHVAAVVVTGTSLAGTTIVTPFAEMIVVDAVDGQEVV